MKSLDEKQPFMNTFVVSPFSKEANPKSLQGQLVF